MNGLEVIYDTSLSRLKIRRTEDYVPGFHILCVLYSTVFDSYTPGGSFPLLLHYNLSDQVYMAYGAFYKQFYYIFIPKSTADVLAAKPREWFYFELMPDKLKTGFVNFDVIAPINTLTIQTAANSYEGYLFNDAQYRTFCCINKVPV